jgi:hypothetical protein
MQKHQRQLDQSHVWTPSSCRRAQSAESWVITIHSTVKTARRGGGRTGTAWMPRCGRRRDAVGEAEWAPRPGATRCRQSRRSRPGPAPVWLPGRRRPHAPPPSSSSPSPYRRRILWPAYRRDRDGGRLHATAVHVDAVHVPRVALPHGDSAWR